MQRSTLSKNSPQRRSINMITSSVCQPLYCHDTYYHQFIPLDEEVTHGADSNNNRQKVLHYSDLLCKCCPQLQGTTFC